MADVTDAADNAGDPGERFATLANRAVEHAKDLVRAELSLARDELQGEARAAAFSLALAILSLVFLNAGFLVLVAALVMTLLGKPLAVAIVGLALLGVAGGAAFAALHAFKRRHLARTRQRISDDAQTLLRFKHE
ncbi:MAG TPA: phage holin family protein [Polyangiaceae bacterium]|jgi:O-antigen/teichoic acid export membrane protein|nr:phage holin family protein [Polyangiaceae bacterium]